MVEHPVLLHILSTLLLCCVANLLGAIRPISAIIRALLPSEYFALTADYSEVQLYIFGAHALHVAVLLVCQL